MSQQAAKRNRQPSLTMPDNRWMFAAFLLTVVVSALLLVLPLTEASSGGTGSEAGQPAGTVETTQVRETLVETNGWPAVVVLLIPVAVAAAPLVTPVRGRRPAAITAAAVLGVGVILGAASVGLFYLPSVVLMVIGAVRQRA